MKTTICPKCRALVEYDMEAPIFECPECGAQLNLKQAVFEFGHLDEAPVQFTGKGFKGVKA